MLWRSTCAATFGLSRRWRNCQGRGGSLSRRATPDLIKSIKVHTKFGSGDQAILIYDIDFAEPIGVCRAAALMTFKDGLIVHKELFFGASLASSARHVASIARYLFMRRSGHHQMGFPGECVKLCQDSVVQSRRGVL
jgi:hypothetical protein